MKHGHRSRLPRLRPLIAGLALALTTHALPAFAQSGHARAIDAVGAIAYDRPRSDGRPSPWRRLLERPSGIPPVVVTNCDDSGPGSLRDVYFNATDGETIDLTQLTCSRITLTSGALTDAPSANKVTINGPGKYQLTIDGNNNGRVFVHNGSGALYLESLTVQNGSYSGEYGGGCIYSHGSVGLVGTIVTQCSMSSTGTSRAYGGAVFANETVTLAASSVTGSTVRAAAANSGGGGVRATSVDMFVSTISGNTALGDGSHYAQGGGAMALGDISIKYSTLSDNEAITGGGIFLLGAAEYPMEIINSTVSGNHSLGAGAGIYTKYRPLNIFNSTIAQNLADFEFGAGVYTASDLEIESSIIANNSSEDGLYASDLGGDASVTITGANNLIVAHTLPVPADTLADDPMLGPLQFNGGYTMTQALLPGSPAIDHGNVAYNASYDQRFYSADAPFGYERVVGANADIGAFETGAPDTMFRDGFDNEL